MVCLAAGGNAGVWLGDQQRHPIALGQPVSVSDLSGLQFTGSATAGKDEIWLRAFDGQWSGWTMATLSDPGVQAPIVAANSQPVAANQSVTLSSIFSVSGSGVSEYQVWFAWPQAGIPADGTVTNNGTPIALGQPVSVSDLSGLQFTGAATPGTDEVWLRAFDGLWSGWTMATLTDPGIPPVSATNQTVAYNQSVALSSIFSVSGSGISQYQIWFSWPEQGEPAFGTVTNNGTPIATDQPVSVSSLSGLQYNGAASSGTDYLWLRTFNGQWSGWTLATIANQSGSNDTIAAGSGNNLIYMSGANQTLLDASGNYNDTVVGFDEGSGDRIQLTTDTVADALAHSAQINGGQDTLITLADSSTILLKGIAHIDNSFFS